MNIKKDLVWIFYINELFFVYFFENKIFINFLNKYIFWLELYFYKVELYFIFNLFIFFIILGKI